MTERYVPNAVLVDETHGCVTIIKAPERAEFSWHMLTHLDPRLGRKDGDMLYLQRGIVYKLTEVDIAFMTCSGVRLK